MMDEWLLYGGLIAAAALLVVAVLLIFVFKLKKQKLEMQFLEEYGKDDSLKNSPAATARRRNPKTG